MRELSRSSQPVSGCRPAGCCDPRCLPGGYWLMMWTVCHCDSHVAVDQAESIMSIHNERALKETVRGGQEDK
jgi:hypothetical protein